MEQGEIKRILMESLKGDSRTEIFNEVFEKVSDEKTNIVFDLLCDIMTTAAKVIGDKAHKNAIEKCKTELCKQSFTMIHSNGYPCEAVPKSTILSLQILVKKP